MPHILKNKNLEVHIDLPHENYQTSRFDWTGKIQSVKFRGIPLSITERNNGQDENLFGKGFYNEFGIETALGFEEAEIGEWFHKIGIGLLKKNESDYFFHKEFEIKPAEFIVNTNSASIEIKCISELFNGYAYTLAKRITLNDDGFTISYILTNTGKKEILSDEYTHNFIAVNNDSIGPGYILKFPFQIKPEEFTDLEERIELGEDQITFNGNPNKQFFIGKLTEDASTKANWELIHKKQKIGIREVPSFKVQKVNLWGWKHVISPELFHYIHLKIGESTEWNRKYEIFNTQ